MVVGETRKNACGHSSWRDEVIRCDQVMVAHRVSHH